MKKKLNTEIDYTVIKKEQPFQVDAVRADDLKRMNATSKSLSLLELKYVKSEMSRRDIYQKVRNSKEGDYLLIRSFNEGEKDDLTVIEIPNHKNLLLALQAEITRLERLEEIELEENPAYLSLTTRKGKMKIRVEEIEMLEAAGNYSYIYTLKKERHLIRGNLTKLYGILPLDKFIRVHRSYIVQFDCITYIRKEEIVIGNYVIPIGRKYKADLKEKYASSHL